MVHAGAVAVHLDEDVLVAELAPSGERIVLCGDGDHWRLVRFLDPGEAAEEVRLVPETTREITLDDFSPDAVLAALGITRPDDVELDVESANLGPGETRTVMRYLFTDAGRSVLAEQITEGATPLWRLLRGVLIDGGRGALVTANRDGAQLIMG